MTESSYRCWHLAACVLREFAEPNKQNKPRFIVHQREIRDTCKGHADTIDKCLDSVADYLSNNTNHKYPSEVVQTAKNGKVLLIDPVVRAGQTDDKQDTAKVGLKVIGAVGGTALAAIGLQRMMRGQPLGPLATIAGAAVSLVSVFG